MTRSAFTGRLGRAAVLAAIVGVTVVGCGPSGEEARPFPEPAATLTYRCEDGVRFHALVREEEALLLLPDRTVTAPAVRSASGARYEARGVLYRSSDDEAQLEVDGRRHDGCSVVDRDSPWARAAREGKVFRAVGQEPGWLVDVHSDGSVQVEADYGQRKLVFPESATRRQDGSTIVTAEHGGRSVVLRIHDEPCSDVMSGFGFPATVRLELEGEPFSGCGRPLVPTFPG